MKAHPLVEEAQPSEPFNEEPPTAMDEEEVVEAAPAGDSSNASTTASTPFLNLRPPSPKNVSNLVFGSGTASKLPTPNVTKTIPDLFASNRPLFVKQGDSTKTPPLFSTPSPAASSADVITTTAATTTTTTAVSNNPFAKPPSNTPIFGSGTAPLVMSSSMFGIGGAKQTTPTFGSLASSSTGGFSFGKAGESPFGKPSATFGQPSTFSNLGTTTAQASLPATEPVEEEIGGNESNEPLIGDVDATRDPEATEEKTEDESKPVEAVLLSANKVH